ncbi:Major MR/P fimbria protein precursor [Serratia rubidaea]|uniref:Major MR/P fimbria protein n=1 Tax=Serratia rubidaea TaxID=61652 RepID=A0A448S6J4_SERRU|nr:fimbrial protein [Serratia rubidaea]AML56199.1 MrfB [Serratia rubidaea]MBD8454086.1 type 1 fimbrial protein [Serratia rubidaea]MBH1930734.1 type 1 fimbrial protein [Serratia rubidaea]MBS0975333.1 type 1 fimbrial protein [Serratia rubidaea]MCR0996899.1 type 1 fimbrial protein [Serratia rubidaea]
MLSHWNQTGALALLAGCALFSATGRAAPAAQGWGQVSMHGAIIDTACAIAAGSRDQTIDMETVPLGQIVRDGRGMTKTFSIELVNCVLERPGNKPDWKFFQVTFDGHADGALFGVQGEARGVALKIDDGNGKRVIPGEPLAQESVTPGNRVLRYSMTLMPNHQPLKAGAYFSTVRFKLDYF